MPILTTVAMVPPISIPKIRKKQNTLFLRPKKTTVMNELQHTLPMISGNSQKCIDVNQLIMMTYQ